MNFAYLILYVPDVTASVTFYERAFGLARRFVDDSGRYAELETGATALAFADANFAPTRGAFRPSRPAEAAAAAEIAFATRDVDAGYARALAAGATAVSSPAAKPWGQVVAYVRDANGFLVELCTPIAA